MVYIDGVGSAPEDADSSIGKCSQYVCFAQKSMVDLLNLNDAEANIECKPSKNNNESQQSVDQKQLSEQSVVSAMSTDTTVVYPIEKFPYKLLFSHEFPEFVETRSYTNIILDDVKYFIHRHTVDDSMFLDEDSNTLIIPIDEMFPFVHQAASVAELRETVQNYYTIDNNNCIVYSLNDDSSSSSNDSDYDYNQSNDVPPETAHQGNDNDEEW